VWADLLLAAPEGGASLSPAWAQSGPPDHGLPPGVYMGEPGTKAGDGRPPTRSEPDHASVICPGRVSHLGYSYSISASIA